MGRNVIQFKDKDNNVYDVKDVVARTTKADVIINNTESAPITSVKDAMGDMPVKTLEVQIDPVQDLHGYDSPWPAGGGKNVLFNDYNNTYNGVTVVAQSDGSVILNGTTTNGDGVRISSNYIVKDGSTQTISLFGHTNTGITDYGLNGFGVAKTIIRSGADFGTWFSAKCPAGTTFTNVHLYPQIEMGSTASATWSPYENLCPISGWTSADVTRTGKNLLNPSEAFDRSDIYTVNDDGTVTVLKADGRSWDNVTSIDLPSGTYTLSVNNPTGQSVVRLSSENYSTDHFYNSTSGYTFTFTEPGAIKLKLSYTGTFPKTEGVMLNIGMSASTFEPYNASEIEYEFPEAAGTVYGGTLTIHQDGSGELVVDHFLYEYDGTETFSKSGTALNGFYNQLTGGTIPHNWPKMLDYNQASTYTDEKSSMFILTRNANTYKQNYGYCLIDSGHNFDVPPETFGTTVESFKAKLAELYAAGTPVSVFCKIATPVTYQLTNQQVVSLLKGTNNIWSNTGNTAIEYAADTKLYIDGKIAELQALILES